ncbi:BZ3500_MvSof-1268-A1-R1_Chr1-3g02387 [Microbotryum saponariae]|uniref:BZ3500_MvSof-1268-A1-R1_Chr1-3g02387 protein n=1 Tax=Microbotryum saponariae TaxID=289078 RepID=A0A2X0MUD7_9BASI|nr:BZ3500_MvSof-1268-A1-R1_Chr1-3g02387 [Microbotryum saponariae]SCZ96174.1 BZ3501_MvSof-1269-A2-R1_Chr1-3g01990 [Microbotryum saponariae]
MVKAQELEKGDTVKWQWGSGEPKGKVEGVVEGDAKVTTNKGNEVTRKGSKSGRAIGTLDRESSNRIILRGSILVKELSSRGANSVFDLRLCYSIVDEENPAVKIKADSGNKAIKKASELSGVETGKSSGGKKGGNKKKDNDDEDEEAQEAEEADGKEDTDDDDDDEEESAEDEKAKAKTDKLASKSNAKSAPKSESNKPASKGKNGTATKSSTKDDDEDKSTVPSKRPQRSEAAKTGKKAENTEDKAEDDAEEDPKQPPKKKGKAAKK